MSEFEDKLGAILSDPNAMSQIMTLAQSLGGSTPPSEDAVSAPPAPAPPASSAPDLSGCDGLQEGCQRAGLGRRGDVDALQEVC